MKPLTPEHALAMHFASLLIRGDDALPAGFEDRRLALSHFDQHGGIVTDPKEELER